MKAAPSQIRYEAHPSMLRMRPFATLLVLVLMLIGLLTAVLGNTALPASLAGALGQLDPRVLQTVGLVVFALAALQLLIWWVSTRTDHLQITDEEILRTHGLLSKQYTEIGMGSVRTIRVSQSLFQRIMNAGDIAVFTAGDVPELLVRGLPQPDRIRELVKARGGAASPA